MILAVHVMHMGVAFEYAVLAKCTEVANAILYRHIIGESVCDNLLAPTTDQANKIARFYALGHCSNSIAVHFSG